MMDNQPFAGVSYASHPGSGTVGVNIWMKDGEL